MFRDTLNPTMKKITTTLSILLLCFLQCSLAQDQQPNILIIIADDMGVDVTPGFQTNANMPTTPVLTQLQADGLAFTNTWATPQCTPSRASILSGKYGIKTGVMRPPGNLDLVHESIFTRLNAATNDTYATAVIGKWHVSNPVDFIHTQQHGIDYYDGFFNAGVDDYYDWEKVTNGVVSQETDYVTSYFTDAASDWIADQDQPWFLWLAQAAPHTPFHLPPDSLYTVDDTGDNQGKYFAAIEAMDKEIGRLLENIGEEALKNTLIIFVGDNGTPGRVSPFFQSDHGKGTLYEGGVRVPMIIKGCGVDRVGEQEAALTHIADIYSTILEVAGIPLPGGIHNSLSLKPYLSCTQESKRAYIYTDYEDGNRLAWAIRNDQYKLIDDENGNQEFYDIQANLLEDNNLINSLDPTQQAIKEIMENEANRIRTDWSCRDNIKNGNEQFIDDCDDDCTLDNSLSTQNIGCCEQPADPSVFYEFIENTERKIYTNNFPNHNYCFNPNNIPEQKYYLFELDKTPSLNATKTKVIRDNGRPARYFGVALNGVIMAPAPATPFIFENPNTGQFNWDWVFEPTNNQGDGRDLVALDCASAHTGPQGYHYHGNMFEYLEGISPGISTTQTLPDEPIHIGWAADGFPILYRFGPDKNGQLKILQPSYQLKAGLRPGNGIEEPCGAYNGKYTNDYEYICGKGDLDECNGSETPVTVTTAEGEQTFNYFYVITATFPQIPRCLSGTPSPDFDNGNDELMGTDMDNDGFIDLFDCDDTDASINPLAVEIEGNDIDENCDGFLTSTDEALVASKLTIGPNPSLGQINILYSDPDSYRGQELKVSIFNIYGQLIRVETGWGEINVENLSAGSYLFRIEPGNFQGSSTQQQIIRKVIVAD